VYAAPLASEADGLIVVLQDVSEIKRLERLRQEFVANVSHELKTPLAVIKASTETLIDGAADDPVHRRAFLDQIDEQSNRLHALILDLLALARIEGAEAAPEPTAVPLHQCAAEAVERHRNRASAKGVELKVADAPPVTAWTDEEAVEIILDNLIDNAIKYTPEGGSIVVSSGSGGESSWLEVSDTGVGIPESDLPRVFERFYRVDKARSRELGGTGLGLSIVKRLAQANGGSVTARSSPGRGSAFVVRLPRVPAGMNPAAHDASPPR
jgi:two-component system phosphate regulon sensor histidine kinase PhoR